MRGKDEGPSPVMAVPGRITETGPLDSAGRVTIHVEQALGESLTVRMIEKIMVWKKQALCATVRLK